MRAVNVSLLLLTLATLLLFGVRQPAPLLATSGRAASLDRPTAPEANQTRTLQQGLNGYNGVRDTWISTAAWETPPQYSVNYGQNQALLLSRTGGDNPLLRFDLSSIPAHSAVISATLYLYNTMPSSNGSGDFVRRVQLFRTLQDWDEGNQTASAIDGAGKRGATGDHAFDYFTGQGTDVAWNARGMAADSDYAATAISQAEVVNEGWYSWDATSLVRAWVRGEQPNYGMVLRDATGYEDNNNDSRSFVASQAANAALRPKLIVVYNPDVPFANAGPDQETLNWSGGAVTLDASASNDRPGGNDASLVYTWRIVQAAFGSALSGNLAPPSGNKMLNFTPDVAGEWEIELTVTNNVGESATDRVHLRLLKIAASHPRLFLTPAKLAALQARAVAGNSRWTQLLAEADNPDGGMHAKALVAQVTGQSSYCDQAIVAALALIASANNFPTKAGDLALVYDWCYSRLSNEQRTTFNDYFDSWHLGPKTEDTPGWGNYWPRHGYSYALVGLATYGDNAQAQAWLDEFRQRRYEENDLPLLALIADGGAWPEGMVYDWIANWPRVMAVEGWRTASGEDLFASTNWYQDRLGYILLHRWPGLAQQFGFNYHPYPGTGDSERNRGSLTNYERVMALVLIERFGDAPLARQLQAMMDAPPTNNTMRFLYHAEFLWFNPDQPTTPPTTLTHYAAGTGTLFLRSGWPSGAADDDPSATHITFQTGDHYTYHQHFDQNSFTLFKGGDLIVDSGVYSGEGLSNHDINYYVRTIAHNTLVVYNPAEDFAAARPDATANDGGQRTVFPGSRSPQTLDYFEQHAVHYDTGDILRFEDNAAFTYALGDATKAYNNPTYNQAMDTGLSGNTAKVSRFQREFVYLREAAGPPQSSALDQAAGEFLILFDRVGVTQESYSGANTKLLFHTLNEPSVNGTATTVGPGETLYANATLATASSGDGKVFIQTLLPAARNLRKVGGRGDKSFWAFDDNYDWHWAANEAQPRPINDFEDAPYGEWRLELEPADTALEHNFLTILHPTTDTAATMPATNLLTATGLAGVHIVEAALNRVVLFSAASDGSAPSGTLAYSYRPTARTLHLLFDLTPGARYRLTQAQNGDLQNVTLARDANGTYQASDQGVLNFVLEMDGEPSDQLGLFLPMISD